MIEEAIHRNDLIMYINSENPGYDIKQAIHR